jgi:glycosyltransferase involved in cell wall biosynthesis
MDKKVSIVMCTCNGAKYLKEQLETIVNQTYPIYELIVQDDCSTDNTFEILREYSNVYSYISLHNNSTRIGVNKNFFSAMKRATGDYIAISDQDDIWEPDKIEKQMATIGNNWLSFHISKPFSENNAPAFFSDKIPNYGIERMIFQSYITGHTMLIKKEVLSMIPEESKEKFMYDWLLQVVVAAYDKISFCKQILVHQRRHYEAATYTKPLDTKLNIANSIATIFRTFFLYIELRKPFFERAEAIFRLLKSLPVENPAKSNAENLALYISQKGLIAYCKLACLCIKLRRKIFYADEKTTGFPSPEPYIFQFNLLIILDIYRKRKK